MIRGLLTASIFMLMPISVLAEGEPSEMPTPQPPEISAEWTTDGALRLEIADEEQRYTLEVSGQRGRSLSAGVVNSNGESATIEIQNRYYTPPGADALTPEGNGTVMDDIIPDNNKEIFTFTTPEGHEYFLIIDRSRDTENVYLLNAVTDSDLAGLSNGAVARGSSVIVTPPPTQQPAPAQTSAPTAPASRGENNQYFFIVAAILVFGGIVYYFKIHRNKGKKKKKAATHDEYEDEPDDDDFTPNDQIAFGVPDHEDDEEF